MLQTQQRLGDFEIVRLLGKGGMGEVYEAQQLNPPRRVALKVLAPWLAQDEEMLSRFWREAVVPAQLDHPGIVRIIATGKTDDVAWYAMQLVRGVSLAQLVRQAGDLHQAKTTPQATAADVHTPTDSPAGAVPALAPAPGDDAAPPVVQEYHADRYAVVARLGAQAARALASAHRHDVLHRDVKPSNLMADHQGQLYVVDFGLTRAFVGDGLTTRLGTVCGTPWYMSPEQARGEVVDARSDVYSLGVTLYDLATAGKGPFLADRKDGAEVLRQVKGNQALPLRVFAPDVPPALAAVIERAMHFKPGRRYQTAAELAAALEALAPVSGLAGQAPPRRRRLVVALLLTIVLILAGVATWLSLRPGAAPPTAGDANHAGRRDDPPAPPAAAARPAMPASLRHRELRVNTALLNDRFVPLWPWAPTGTANYFSGADSLHLVCYPNQSMALLALDDDPQRHWFEFSVQLRPLRQRSSLPTAAGQAVAWGNVPGSGPLLAAAMLVGGGRTPRGYATGIFFGWPFNARDPGKRHSVFVAQLEEPPLDRGGPTRLTFGFMAFDNPAGLRGRTIEGLRPLPGVNGVRLLPSLPAAREGWHQFRVRALDGRVRLTVDECPPIQFDMDNLPRPLREGDGRLDPRGALGVWVEKGPTYVREAYVKALPPGP